MEKEFPRFFVIVPDGLLIDKNKFASLSKNYISSLNLCFQNIKANDFVLLLPANSFECNTSEEELAKKYLLNLGLNKNTIFIGNKNYKKYIDTAGNFISILKWGFNRVSDKKYFNFNKIFIDGNYSLICSHLHLDRSIICIKYLGLKVPKNIYSSFAFEDKKIASRLFYYRFPLLRMIYEIFATIYTIIKLKIFKYMGMLNF